MSAKKARDLAAGDLIDLQRHSWFAEWDEGTRTAAEYELARVGLEDGPHVWEGGTFLLCTDQGVFPTDPDATFTVEGVDR
jgi:hypothetical protein